VAHKPKSVKIKITDKDHKELLAHYFDPKNGLDDDGQTLTIPESILKTFRNQKLHMAVKESSFGMFEKDSFKTDIPLADLYRTNEISKSCKFDKVNFEVII
jgi:tRNA U34 5-methylaminomethyl-2-thiouridine-forming methyltransferase MnmC